MRRFWPFKWSRSGLPAATALPGPFPATSTAEVLQTIIDQFNDFVSAPPSDGLEFGDFADYSRDTPQDRDMYGATIYLNRVVANRSMHEVANDVAQLLEQIDYRPRIRKGPTGEFQVYVPWVFLNSTQ